jgi:hypothetical protein
MLKERKEGFFSGNKEDVDRLKRIFTQLRGDHFSKGYVCPVTACQASFFSVKTKGGVCFELYNLG